MDNWLSGARRTVDTACSLVGRRHAGSLISGVWQVTALTLKDMTPVFAVVLHGIEDAQERVAHARGASEGREANR